MALDRHGRHGRGGGRGDELRTAGVTDLAVLQCVSDYPAAAALTNLRVMDSFARAFGTRVGSSITLTGLTVAIAAVARGAAYLEKHFTLDRSLPGPDHQASLLPAEAARAGGRGPRGRIRPRPWVKAAGSELPACWCATWPCSTRRGARPGRRRGARPRGPGPSSGDRAVAVALPAVLGRRTSWGVIPLITLRSPRRCSRHDQRSRRRRRLHRQAPSPPATGRSAAVVENAPGLLRPRPPSTRTSRCSRAWTRTSRPGRSVPGSSACPPRIHAPTALALARQGQHIFMEKPVSHNRPRGRAGGRARAARARRHDRLLAVRFFKPLQKAKELCSTRAASAAS